MAGLIEFLENNLVSLLLPILSAFLAWFFSRKRQESEITKTLADTEKTEAERVKILAETESISVSAAQQAVAMWTQISERNQREIDSLKLRIIDLEHNQVKIQRTLEVYMEVTDFLLHEMERYNPETASIARQKLKDGLKDG